MLCRLNRTRRGKNVILLVAIVSVKNDQALKREIYIYINIQRTERERETKRDKK